MLRDQDHSNKARRTTSVRGRTDDRLPIVTFLRRERHQYSSLRNLGHLCNVGWPPGMLLNIQHFVKGAYAVAIDAILGACILLGKFAIGYWLTAAIGIVSLAVLFRWRISSPLLVAATVVVGLSAHPWLQPACAAVK